MALRRSRLLLRLPRRSENLKNQEVILTDLAHHSLRRSIRIPKGCLNKHWTACRIWGIDDPGNSRLKPHSLRPSLLTFHAWAIWFFCLPRLRAWRLRLEKYSENRYEHYPCIELWIAPKTFRTTSSCVGLDRLESRRRLQRKSRVNH
jgi:hypothetical protein